MPAVVSASSVYASNAALTSAPVLAVPGGAAAGDFLLVALSGSGGMPAGVTPPAGWTTYIAPASTTGSADNNYAVYTKVATGADIAGGSFTFTLVNASVISAACLDITGSNNTIRGNRKDPATGAVGDVTTTALAGVQASDLTLMLCWGGADDGAGFTIGRPGAPWAGLVNVSSSFPGGPSAHNLAAAAAPGVQAGATWTRSGSDELLVFTLAVEAGAAVAGGGADRHHHRGYL